MRSFRNPLTLLFAGLLLAGILAGQSRPFSAQAPSVTAKDILPEPGREYAGAARCRTCHRAETVSFTKTAHATLEPKNKDAITSCEMCHGPGKAHADAMDAAGDSDKAVEAAKKLIFSFNGNPKNSAAKCQTCHESSRDQRNQAHSSHMQHGVDCSACHSMHLVTSNGTVRGSNLKTAQAAFFNVPSLPEETRWLRESQLRKTQPDLCYSCHGNIQAQFALPTHHRVPEGAMKCTDCHNTHGTSNRATLRQSGWETCVNCHVEKRGPFVFEHSAVKVEGCIICHTPHGSVNRMLMVRREERFLCLGCHVNPQAINVPHSRLSFQTRADCTRCHTAIHGSNFDPAFTH